MLAEGVETNGVVSGRVVILRCWIRLGTGWGEGAVVIEIVVIVLVCRSVASDISRECDSVGVHYVGVDVWGIQMSSFYCIFS